MNTDRGIIIPSEETYKGAGWIETQHGRFALEAPQFSVADIAHASAQTVRYNGHGSFFYSVAEHEVLVSLLIEEELGGTREQAFEGLLHDGTEAYLSDVPAPFKQFLPDWSAIDKRTEKSLREAFGLPVEKSAIVKEADWLALFIEAAQLLPSRGSIFTDPQGFRPRAMELRDKGWHIAGLNWVDAKLAFIRRYNELRGGRVAA